MNGVGRLVPVAIDLIIHGNSIPVSRSRSVITVENCGIAVQSDGVEQEMSIGGTLHLQGEMVPGIAFWITGNPARNPVLTRVAPGVPLVSAINSALMTTNVRLAVYELVDVEFKSL